MYQLLGFPRPQTVPETPPLQELRTPCPELRLRERPQAAVRQLPRPVPSRLPGLPGQAHGTRRQGGTPITGTTEGNARPGNSGVKNRTSESPPFPEVRSKKNSQPRAPPPPSPTMEAIRDSIRAHTIRASPPTPSPITLDALKEANAKVAAEHRAIRARQTPATEDVYDATPRPASPTLEEEPTQTTASTHPLDLVEGIRYPDPDPTRDEDMAEACDICNGNPGSLATLAARFSQHQLRKTPPPWRVLNFSPNVYPPSYNRS